MHWRNFILLLSKPFIYRSIAGVWLSLITLAIDFRNNDLNKAKLSDVVNKAKIKAAEDQIIIAKRFKPLRTNDLAEEQCSQDDNPCRCLTPNKEIGVDMIYVINLKDRPDRLKTFMGVAKKQQIDKNVCIYNPEYFKSTRIHIGSSQSSWEAHRAVCSHAVHHNYNSILVLEDDADFLLPWKSKLKEVLEKTKPHCPSLWSQKKIENSDNKINSKNFKSANSVNMQLSNYQYRRVLLGSIPLLSKPVFLSNIPAQSGVAISIHAYAADVESYCSHIVNTPYTERILQDNNFAVDDCHVSRWNIASKANTIFNFFMLRYLNKLGHKIVELAPSTSLDMFLAVRLSNSTLTLPFGSWQNNNISDQPSLMEAIQGRAVIFRNCLFLVAFIVPEIAFQVIGYFFVKLFKKVYKLVKKKKCYSKSQ